MANTLKTVVLSTGERYCILVDSITGVPLYYPNLYVTTQVRNRSMSYSMMEATLGGISVLLRYMESRNQIIEDQFQSGNYFLSHEIDAIRDFCQINFASMNNLKSSVQIFSISELIEFDCKVDSQTEYTRLTTIAQYSRWLAGQLTSNQGDELKISKMEKGFKAIRPVKRKRNTEKYEKGLIDNQLNLIFEILRPNSELNPFDEPVRVRNRLIFLMLYNFGLRRGELLNIKIDDIKFDKNQLEVKRRADEKTDPRTNQPLVKTLSRLLHLDDVIANEIHIYIKDYRSQINNSSKHKYLFITHKSGPTEGLPLSKSGYGKVIEVVREVSPELYNLTGHQLRHSWNEKFSKQMDEMDVPPSEEEQEKLRSYLMGWREGSGTAAHYNKRFIKEKANKASLKLQEGLIRLPKGLKDGKN